MASHGLRVDCTNPWRLSRIEEELERVESAEDLTSDEFPAPPPMALSLPGSREGTLRRVLTHMPPPLPPLQSQQSDEDNIYSKAILKPSLKDKAHDDLLAAKEALKYINEKYDSLGRVKPASPSTPGTPDSAGRGVSMVQYPESDSHDASGQPIPYYSTVREKNEDASHQARRSPSPSCQSKYGTYPGRRSKSQDSGQPHHREYTQYTHQARELPPTPVNPPPQASTPVNTPRTPQQEPRFSYDSHHVQREQQRQSRDPTRKIPLRTPSPLPPPPPTESSPRVPPVVSQATHAAYHGESERLSEQDILQVEMFYRSHKTEVYVCQCSVHLYMGKAHVGMSSRLLSSAPPPPPGHGRHPSSFEYAPDWTFVKTGVAVVVMDSGESRRHRKLYLVLAERGTGFVLWRDGLDHLSQYSAPQSTFHTFHHSTDHSRLAGLAFSDSSAASQFLARILSLTSDPGDPLLQLSAGGNNKKKSKKSSRKQKQKMPTKADISSPCCFTHVTKLDQSDGVSMLSQKPAPPAAATCKGHAKVKASPKLPRM